MRYLASLLCGAILIVATAATAHGAYGDRCHGPVTTIFGTDGPDSYLTGFIGTSESDVMFAFADDDIVSGGLSSDALCGAQGNDLILGGDERRAGLDAFGDHLFGGGGRDHIRSGGGHDFAYGGAGADRISGGRGNDFADGQGGPDDIRGGSKADELHGGAGDDTLDASGGRFGDHVFGDEGTDTCIVDAADVVDGCENVEVV
jgi:Ca2+-binding RTX toxin-like protein